MATLHGNTAWQIIKYNSVTEFQFYCSVIPTSERLLAQEKNALLGQLCSLKYLSQKFVSVNLFLVQKIRLNLFSGGRVLLDLTALLNHTPVNRF